MYEQQLKKSREERLTFIETLFICFCLMPFLIPNPIVVTNIQPYAALFGTLVILKQRYLRTRSWSYEVTAIGTFIVAIFVLLFGTINVSAFRAVYNYYAVAVVPVATIFVIRKIGAYPEKLVKGLILVWFAVSSVQMFVYRGFMTQLIGGVRWSEGYRGVVGLASEPSFLGIASFFFLHMVQQFKTKRLLFTALVLIMGVLYAQSAMGVLFIAGFLAIFLLEEAEGWRGIAVWAAATIGVVVFLILLDTTLANTRISEIYHSFINGGMDELSEDVSAGNRMDSITEALSNAFNNFLLPMGFQMRIGSGYGGFLCELGFFSIPIMIWISWGMALSFPKKHCRMLYFIVVTILLFNNTQIGNPMMLFVIGSNIALCEIRRSNHQSNVIQPVGNMLKGGVAG